MNSEAIQIQATSIETVLRHGYVRNWLVAGPLAEPVEDLARYPGADFKQQIARDRAADELEIEAQPAELAPVGMAGDQGDGPPLTWRVFHTEDDRFVNCSAFYHTCHHLRTWAYCQLALTSGGALRCVLTTNGPADVWINGRHVHRHLHFHHQIPHSVEFVARLDAGRNEVMVRFEAVAVRECPYVMALQFPELDDDSSSVFLPTTIASLERRQRLEAAMAHAYLEKSIYHRNDLLRLHWAKEMDYRGQLTARLQTREPTGRGRIYAEAQPMVGAGAVTDFGAVYQVPSGDYELVLMPLLEEYYIHGMRVQRRLPLTIVNDRYAERPTGRYDERRREALVDAAGREQNVFSEIAKMALDRWPEVKQDVILRTIAQIDRRADCSDFYLVGLLGMLIRFAGQPGFPDELRQPLEACILHFRYWMDEPGDDAMCFWSENHQILFHTCAVLAGQLLPDCVFGNTGETGRWHRAKGERMALDWLRKRGAGGFREWDSNTYFEEDALALSHLADLADSVELAEMAAIVLDKLFFCMAVNSFNGAFGSTHGRTYSPFIKSARLEPTSGMSRLAFGMGCFNNRVLGTVSLACAQGYEVPELIAAIAADQPEESWNRERHAGMLEPWCDRDAGEWEVNKVTYRTPDYMLSSAQDYRPGAQGYQQHIWQATFGPDALVFVTHPPCSSEEGSHRPNAWHGNVVLPRVAQWKDFLVGVYNFPADDWMGFTHAYFPAAAFDEHSLRDGWAFARSGDGYIALTAARGVALVSSGLNAGRELRSFGSPNVWICHMGRRVLDGEFIEFQDKILNLAITLGESEVEARTLRGQHVRFGWQGPLLVDGESLPLSGFKHFANPYCDCELGAGQMEIRFQDLAMRLDFGGV